MDNRPRSREKYVTGQGAGVHKKGTVSGGGTFGGGSGGGSGSGGGFPTRAAAGGGGLVTVILVVIFALMGGKLGGGSSTPASTYSFEDIATQDSAWTADASNVKLNTNVAAGARAKRTKIKADGNTVTIMVYMCGTDLESKSSMATNDIKEMLAADLGKNINLLIYTGGCKRWQNNQISNKTNQIYQIKNGKLHCLVDNDGAKVMTDPNTLSSFIQWCHKKFPADRNELIFWDHGGGSISGYGYDEKYANKGSMSLSGINKALKAGGVTFDFIGFDACLMATTETALMLDSYGDYLIASEETEPGIGWYYTNWLTAFGKDTSLSTLEVAKKIIDDYTAKCGQVCRGQKTTLSVIDLAEFSQTVPEPLTGFSKSISSLIGKKEYKKVSDARYGTREFAQSSRIDQVDLVHLTKNMNTTEGEALAKVLTEAVKYNRTSSNMTNAYGISIYFPYQRTSHVDSMVNTYQDIGMDPNYTKCIREFASLETSGQIAAGGTGNPLGALLGQGGTSALGTDAIGSLLGSFLTGGYDRIAGLDSKNISYYSEKPLSDGDTADYIAKNSLSAKDLVWEKKNGKYYLSLPESKWDLVHKLDLNMFYDDGEGYVNLGLDNVYSFEDGKLVADTDNNWLSINNQPVAYYHMDTTERSNDQYTITGRVPVLLNGDKADLILVFDNENPKGYIAGATYDYQEEETMTVAKNMVNLKAGDELQFRCEYYGYDGSYQDEYILGDPMTVTDSMVISNTVVGDGKLKLSYCFTDLYQNEFWSETIPLG